MSQKLTSDLCARMDELEIPARLEAPIVDAMLKGFVIVKYEKTIMAFHPSYPFRNLVNFLQWKKIL